MAEILTAPTLDPSPQLLFAQVFQADIATLKTCKNDLELGTDTLKPATVLVEFYFWGTVAKDGKKSLEHVLSIGDCCWGACLLGIACCYRRR